MNWRDDIQVALHCYILLHIAIYKKEGYIYQYLRLTSLLMAMQLEIGEGRM